MRTRSEERRVGKECRSRWSPYLSSRRRHTRCLSDWSSDVCSSDLPFRRWIPLPSSNPPTFIRLSDSPTLCEPASSARSEEHTSELQSLRHLVCRLLLEK